VPTQSDASIRPCWPPCDGVRPLSTFLVSACSSLLAAGSASTDAVLLENSSFGNNCPPAERNAADRVGLIARGVPFVKSTCSRTANRGVDINP